MIEPQTPPEGQAVIPQLYLEAYVSASETEERFYNLIVGLAQEGGTEEPGAWKVNDPIPPRMPPLVVPQHEGQTVTPRAVKFAPNRSPQHVAIEEMLIGMASLIHADEPNDLQPRSFSTRDLRNLQIVNAFVEG